MYVNGTFSPSISGHSVCCLELPDQNNEKVVIMMCGVCQDEWQLRGQLRKGFASSVAIPSKLELCCLL